MAETNPKSSISENLRAGRKQTIVTYGTSLTALGNWPGILGEALKTTLPGPATIINSAMCGMWSRWGIVNLDERVLRHNPDVVFMEFAINDAYLPYRTSVGDARNNLERMIDRILDRNHGCEIILMTMNPPIGDHLRARPDVAKYVEAYREVAGARKLVLVDQYPVWQRLLAENRSVFDEYVPDGLHPNELGSRMITVPGILRALGILDVDSV